VNALDGFDVAEAVLSKRVMDRLILLVVAVVLLLIALGALNTEQIGTFVYEQAYQRAYDTIMPVITDVFSVELSTTTTTVPPAMPVGG
jgi:uncharacterized membrane protein YciS (DUF1049 family)